MQTLIRSKTILASHTTKHNYSLSTQSFSAITEDSLASKKTGAIPTLTCYKHKIKGHLNTQIQPTQAEQILNKEANQPKTI